MPEMQGIYQPCGFGTFSVDASTSKTLSATAASGANLTAAALIGKVYQVEIVPEGAIRFTLDGSAPTSSAGTPLPSGVQYIVDTDPSKFRFISQSGTVTVNAEFKGR